MDEQSDHEIESENPKIFSSMSVKGRGTALLVFPQRTDLRSGDMVKDRKIDELHRVVGPPSNPSGDGMTWEAVLEKV